MGVELHMGVFHEMRFSGLQNQFKPSVAFFIAYKKEEMKNVRPRPFSFWLTYLRAAFLARLGLMVDENEGWKGKGGELHKSNGSCMWLTHMSL